MNFTQEIKKELIRRAPQSKEEALALFCAVADTGGRADGDGCSLALESEGTAKYLLALAENAGVEMRLTEAGYDPKHGRDKLTFSLREGSSAGLTFTAAGAGEGSLLAYLKGAFLGGGSCTLPRAGTKTGYHLEFEFANKARAEEFREVLDELGFVSGALERGERSVVYIKSREAISDFLSVAGAENSLARFNEVSARREENNHENRALNCSSGNADRAAIASVEQVRALMRLKESGKLRELSVELYLTAEARLENPALSLGELAEVLKLSKSGLNHRLRKLMEIARNS